MIERPITVKEAAQLAHRGERQLRGDIAAGRLRVIRYGRVIRIDPADLREYIEAHKIPKETAADRAGAGR